MLELRELSRRYGNTVALDGLTLDVPEGEVVGFVGPTAPARRPPCGSRSACSSRTPARSCGTARPRRATTSGSSATCRRSAVYPKMRVDRQLRYLASLHGQGAAAEAAGRWIERLGLGERAEHRVEELSLGNQQRVQLAAALVHDPRALILDEPFSGLDPIGTDVMSEVLRERAADGVAVIFSSHQLELVERLCDSVAIVDGGRIVAAGKVDELRAERSRPRLRVDLDGGQDGWLDGVPGVEVVDRDERGVLLELDGGADDQQVLNAARRAGAVRTFARVRPTLAELFREVVER